MKKLIGILIGIIAICAVTYLGFSFYLSQVTNEMVNHAWSHEDELPEKYVGVISEYDYEQMDWLTKFDSSKITTTQSNFAYPSTVWRINTATTTYNYTIKDSTSGEPLDDCDNVKCTIEWAFEDGKWVVKSFTEE